MEDSWLIAFKRLHSLASNGLAFTDSHYEQDRYSEIQTIASQLIANLGNVSIPEVNAALEHKEGGYQTPKVDVRAAVIQQNKILLVKEKTDGLWALPGGYADVGLSAAENAVKEVWEEAGIKVKTTKLYSFRHKAQGEFKPDIRDFYKLYFLCEQIDSGSVLAGSEVLDAGFFSLHDLPELSTGRVVLSDFEAAFKHRELPELVTYFDREDEKALM